MRDPRSAARSGHLHVAGSDQRAEQRRAAGRQRLEPTGPDLRSRREAEPSDERTDPAWSASNGCRRLGARVNFLRRLRSGGPREATALSATINLDDPIVSADPYPWYERL